MNSSTLTVILAMAAVTWACRAGGLLLAGWLPRGGRAGQVLEQMPGCVMAALVVPEVLGGGPAEWASAAVTAVVMVSTRSLPAAMGAGIAAVALMRWSAA